MPPIRRSSPRRSPATSRSSASPCWRWRRSSVAGFEPVSDYWITLLIQIGYLGIAALGLNILVGFTGQISLGHSAFFGFGAFASAWLNNSLGIPVVFSMPLAGLMTTAVGMVFGIPAARIKGLYLAIATLASQFILQDFFARADWFSGGSSGALAAPFSLFGYEVTGDRQYFYVVLVERRLSGISRPPT